MFEMGSWFLFVIPAGILFFYLVPRLRLRGQAFERESRKNAGNGKR